MALSPKRPEGTPRLVLPRLYPILDVDVAEARGLDSLAVLDDWLVAGVRLVQLRAKHLDGVTLLALADHCQRAVQAAGGLLIINDRVDIAQVSGAAGVHLGQADLPAHAARRVLPSPALVGWSTHNDAQVVEASTLPIDYLAIGPVFATDSKTRPDPVVGLDGVRRAVALAGGRPVVAIGGIRLDTVQDVFDAGATSVAVIGDLLQADPAARVRAYLSMVGGSNASR